MPLVIERIDERQLNANISAHTSAQMAVQETGKQPVFGPAVSNELFIYSHYTEGSSMKTPHRGEIRNGYVQNNLAYSSDQSIEDNRFTHTRLELKDDTEIHNITTLHLKFVQLPSDFDRSSLNGIEYALCIVNE